MVDLNQRPSKEELLDLSVQMRKLQASEDMQTLGKVL